MGLEGHKGKSMIVFLVNYPFKHIFKMLFKLQVCFPKIDLFVPALN